MNKMEKVTGEKFLDVDKILSDKNPGLKKWLPKFIINYLKKILHQNDINEILARNKDVFGIEFCQNLSQKEFKLNIEMEGVENIPKAGNVTVTINHPIGGLDAIAFITEFGKYRKDMKVIVNDVLLNFKNMKNIFIGVNKMGDSSKDSFKQINEMFSQDNVSVVFPSGMVSRKKKGKIADLYWKRTFVFKAKENNNPIVPVYIDGQLSNFFYRLSNFRRAIGIKANIEMLFLANEQYKLEGKTIKIKVGKPIYPKDFDINKTDKEIAQDIRTEVYKLKNGN